MWNENVLESNDNNISDFGIRNKVESVHEDY